MQLVNHGSTGWALPSEKNSVYAGNVCMMLTKIVSMIVFQVSEAVGIPAGDFQLYVNRDKSNQLKPSSKSTLKSSKLR